METATFGIPQKKKSGLSPLAWVGIGCVLLLVVGVVLVGVGSCMGLRWLGGVARDFEADMEADPGRTMAEAFVRLNPDLELVSTDDDEGTITIRNTKTGDVGTFDYGDLREGKLSWETEDGDSVSIDARGDGEDGGLVTVRGKDGETTRIGGGAEDVPAWAPFYPGGTAAQAMTTTSGGRATGGFNQRTEDDVDAVLEHYRTHFEDEGWELGDVTRANYGGQRTVVLQAKSPDGARTVNVTATRTGERTEIVVTYEGRS